MVKSLPVIQGMHIRSLGQEDPLEKEMAPHSSILAWEMPWTEEPGGLESMGLQELDKTEELNHHHTTVDSRVCDLSRVKEAFAWLLTSSCRERSRLGHLFCNTEAVTAHPGPSPAWHSPPCLWQLELRALGSPAGGHRGIFWQVQWRHPFWHPWPLGTAEEPVPQINIKGLGFPTPSSAGIGASQVEFSKKEAV